MSLRCEKCDDSATESRFDSVLSAGLSKLQINPTSTGTVFYNNPDLETCPICLESLTDNLPVKGPFATLSCGHAFHVDCIGGWIARGAPDDRLPGDILGAGRFYGDITGSECPICKVPITLNDRNDLQKHRLIQIGIIYRRDGRLAKASFQGGNIYYKGIRGAERVVQMDFPPDSTKAMQFYEGSRDQEHVVRVLFKNGIVRFYNGLKGTEALYRIEAFNKTNYYYEGSKDHEILVRIEYPNGNVVFFETEENGERWKRQFDTKDILKSFFARDGRLIRNERADGTVQIYEGEKGSERVVSTTGGKRRMASSGGGASSAQRINSSWM